MSDLYRLVYASKNFMHGTDAEIAHVIAQILETSQRNNATVDVTGALMFNAGAFAQVLEGPLRAIEGTFERIQRDTRHGDVTVLQCGPAESRGFSNWSMGFVGQSASGRALWDGIAAESGFDLSRLNGDAVFAMLHELVLEEEGIPAAGSVLPPAVEITPQAPAAFDVERVRAELPQLGQAVQDAGRTDPQPASPVSARLSAQTQKAAQGEKVGAALSVLRAALASERQLTTELRNELDEVRIALALSQEQADAVQQERDLWARRAQLLAIALGQEANGVTDPSEQGMGSVTDATDPTRSKASIRAVA